MPRTPRTQIPFEQVVEGHGARILRVTRALLPQQDAEDAAADTLLAALEAYPRLRPGSDVRAWLVTIAHRKALDVLRRRSRHAVPTGELPEGPPPGGALPAADPTADAVAGDEKLWAAVRALPVKQRQAVAYRYVADLGYPDIAAVMGVSQAAARRSAADGVATLRRTYPSEPGGPPGPFTPIDRDDEETP